MGSLQGFIGAAISLPTGIVTAAFLLRQLGPEQYGVLTAVCFIIIFIETSISLGFENAAVKATAETEHWQDKAGVVLRAQLLISGIAALSTAAAASPVTGWMKAPDLAFYLQVYAIGIRISGMAKIHQAVLVGRGHYHLRAWLNGGYWLVRMLSVILLVLIRPSVTAVLCANMISTALVLVAARWTVRPAFLTSEKDEGLRQLWMVITWPLYFLTMSLHFFQAVDLIIVKACLPPEHAGFYAAAKNLTIVPGLVAFSLVPVLLSKLALLLTGSQRRSAGRLLEYSSRTIVCLLPFAGMSAGAADEVVQLIYGADFIPAAPLLAALIFGALAMTLAHVNTAGLIAAGHTRMPLYILGPLIPLTIAAHYHMIINLGVLGAALTTTFASIFAALVTILFVCHFWQVTTSAVLWFKSALITLLAWLPATLLETFGLWLLVKLALISAGILIGQHILGVYSFPQLKIIVGLDQSKGSGL